MTMADRINRRQAVALGGALAIGGLAGALPAEAATWQLRWSPEAGRDGLSAFEGVEDDRADSHAAGQPHIFVQDDNFRFNMHLVDRDSSTDRQRQEVKGMRQPAGGSMLTLAKGQTWRLTHQLFIPSSLKATTTFTHIMQLKMPGDGSSPIVVMSLRRNGSTPTIEVRVFASNTLVGRVNLAPLQNKWIDTLLEFTIADGTGGKVRWAVHDGAATVIDATKSGVDTWLGDRVRPKWGIYRSLGDTSGSLADCYLLIRAMRAYQLV
jgi:chitin-binding protein